MNYALLLLFLTVQKSLKPFRLGVYPRARTRFRQRIYVEPLGGLGENVWNGAKKSRVRKKAVKSKAKLNTYSEGIDGGKKDIYSLAKVFSN